MPLLSAKSLTGEVAIRPLPVVAPTRGPGPLPNHAAQVIRRPPYLSSVNTIPVPVASPFASPFTSVVVIAAGMGKVNELEVADAAVPVGIETLLKLSHFTAGKVKTELIESPGKLLSVDDTIGVAIKMLERIAHAPPLVRLALDHLSQLVRDRLDPLVLFVVPFHEIDECGVVHVPVVIGVVARD